ncbi:MAG: hypothetical protein ACJAZ1_000593, partial [Yoonia sp.]
QTGHETADLGTLTRSSFHAIAPEKTIFPILILMLKYVVTLTENALYLSRFTLFLTLYLRFPSIVSDPSLHWFPCCNPPASKVFTQGLVY